MAKKHHFFNTYLTATVSVSLVLLLIGMECVLGLSADNLFRQVKENVNMSVVLKDETTSEDSLRFATLLDAAPFCREFAYISKEDALKEHVEKLGEDPEAFLGYNPLQASFEVKLNAPYIQVDSVAAIDSIFRVFPFVDKVVYQKDMIGLLDYQVNRLSIVLLAVALILLIVSLALIINTVRLHVYSKRFSINTMQLVGATPWIIKGPIVWKTVLLGIIAAMMALAMIAGILYAAHEHLGIWLIPMTWQNLAFLTGVVVVAAFVITFFSSVFAVNKYIRMKTSDLYYV